MLIGATHGFQCAGSYRTMEDALQGIAADKPDVILTDLGLPGMNGVDGTRPLRACFPHIAGAGAHEYDDDDNVFSAICAGASGYLRRTRPRGCWSRSRKS